MAGYFKKRRVTQSPNKNEEKVMRARNAEEQARSGGVLSSIFPPIKLLKIHFTFLDNHQHLLEEKTLVYGPSDTAVFTVSCIGQCGQGSFDFGGKLAEAVNNRQPVSESSAKCPEPLYAASMETC